MLYFLTKMEDEDPQIASNDELMAALIFEVQNQEVIWNRKAKHYKNAQQLKLAWANISQNLGVEEEYLKKSWRKIYDNYSKAVMRRSKVMASGAPYSKLPQCKFLKELTFLKDRKGSTNNMISDSDNSNDSIMATNKPIEQNSLPTPTSNPKLNFPINGNTIPIKQSTTEPNVNWVKRKRNNEECLDLLIKTLEKNNEKTKDDDELFLLSLVPQMKRLTSKKNNLARIKMQQLLYDMEYSTDD